MNDFEDHLKEYIFDNFQDAFYFCEKENKPIIVKVNEQRWKIYPNGDAKPLSDKRMVTINLTISTGDDENDVTSWSQFHWDPETGEIIDGFDENKEDNI